MYMYIITSIYIWWLHTCRIYIHYIVWFYKGAALNAKEQTKCLIFRMILVTSTSQHSGSDAI